MHGMTMNIKQLGCHHWLMQVVAVVALLCMRVAALKASAAEGEKPDSTARGCNQDSPDDCVDPSMVREGIQAEMELDRNRSRLMMLTFTFRWSEAGALCDHLLGIASEEPDARVRARIQWELAVYLKNMERFDQAIKILRCLLDQALAGSELDETLSTDSLEVLLSVGLMKVGRYEEALALVAAGLERSYDRECCKCLRWRTKLLRVARLVHESNGDLGLVRRDEGELESLSEQMVRVDCEPGLTHMCPRHERSSKVGDKDIFVTAGKYVCGGGVQGDLCGWMGRLEKGLTHERAAELYRMKGDYENALLSYGRALALFESLSPEPNKRSLTGEYEYAFVECPLGRHVQALERLKRAALSIRGTRAEKTWHEAFISEQILGLSLKMGDKATAIEAAEVLAKMIETLGYRDHPLRRWAIGTLCETLAEERRVQHLLKWVGEWVRLAEACRGCHKSVPARALSIHAKAACADGRPELARELFDRANEWLAREPRAPTDSGEIKANYMVLFEYFRCAKEYNQGEEVALKCLDDPRIAFPENVTCGGAVIEALLDQKKGPEAARLMTMLESRFLGKDASVDASLTELRKALGP